MPGIETGYLCSARNRCALVVTDGEACGKDPNHLSTVANPGDLCVTALWQHYQDVVLRDPAEVVWAPSKQTMKEAGLLIELGLTASVSETESQEYLHRAEQLIDDVLSNPRSQFPYYSNARLGKIFLPAYAAYRHGEMATAEVRVQQRVGISALMQEVREAPIHQSAPSDHINDPKHQPCFVSTDFQKGTYAKLAGLSMSLAEGMNILPATSRSRAVCDAFIFYQRKVIPARIRIATHLKPNDHGTIFKLVSLERLANYANQLPDYQLIMRLPDRRLVELAMRQLESDGVNVRDNNPTTIQKVVDGMGFQLRRLLAAA